MSAGLVTVSYIGASILFVLSLGGLSKQDTARQGNVYGMVGMAIAIITTVSLLDGNRYFLLIPIMGLAIFLGMKIARKVEMTQMPQLVALLHSFVGMAAVLVALASHIAPSAQLLSGSAKLIHELEIS